MKLILKNVANIKEAEININGLTIAAQADFPGLYGGFMNPDWVSEDGSKIGFLMSVWHPVYNVVLMEMELEK